jgi:hypothetical protein
MKGMIEHNERKRATWHATISHQMRALYASIMRMQINISSCLLCAGILQVLWCCKMKLI